MSKLLLAKDSNPVAGIVQNIYLTVIDVRDAVRKWNGWKIDDAKLTPEFKNRIQKLILDNMEEGVFTPSVLTDATAFLTGGEHSESILAWAKLKVVPSLGDGGTARFGGAKLLASVQRQHIRDREIGNPRAKNGVEKFLGNLETRLLPLLQNGETSRERGSQKKIVRCHIELPTQICPCGLVVEYLWLAPTTRDTITNFGNPSQACSRE